MFKVGDRVQFKAYPQANGVPFIGTVTEVTGNPNPKYNGHVVSWDGAGTGRYFGYELLPLTQAALQHAWDDMGTPVDVGPGKQPAKACTCGAAKVKDHGHSTWCDIQRAS